MIYLVHGPDTVSSRAFLLKLKANYQGARTVDAKALEKNQDTLLQSQSLFEKRQILIIENLKPSQDKPLKPSEGLDIVIWVDELITPPTWVDKAISFKAVDQASPFRLADAVAYGQEKLAFAVLEKLLVENTPSELIVGALTRQIRLLGLGLKGEWEQVSKSSFLQDKVREQTRFWSWKKLKNATVLLLKADWDVKSGNLDRAKSLTYLVAKLCDLART